MTCSTLYISMHTPLTKALVNSMLFIMFIYALNAPRPDYTFQKQQWIRQMVIKQRWRMDSICYNNRHTGKQHAYAYTSSCLWRCRTPKIMFRYQLMYKTNMLYILWGLIKIACIGEHFKPSKPLYTLTEISSAANLKITATGACSKIVCCSFTKENAEHYCNIVQVAWIKCKWFVCYHTLKE